MSNTSDEEDSENLDHEYELNSQLYTLLLKISSDERILKLLKEILIQLIIEQLNCKIIMDYILDEINRIYYKSSNEDIDTLRRDIHENILNMKFKLQSHENVLIYQDLMKMIVSELKNKNLTLSVLINTIFKKVMEEYEYNIRMEKIKIMLGLKEKDIKKEKALVNKDLKNVVNKGSGLQLKAQEGSELRKADEILNLANLQKETQLDKQKIILQSLISSYNNIYKSKLINASEIEKIRHLWFKISKASDDNKKHIENYMMYTIKLVKPEITYEEIKNILRDRVISQSLVNKYFSDFFEKNKLLEYKIYGDRHKQNMLGYVYDTSELINILENYEPKNHAKISPKIIDEIKKKENILSLIEYLDKNRMIKLTFIPNNDNKESIILTKRKVEELVKREV